MNTITRSILALLIAGCGLSAVPCEASFSALHRDAAYEQNLRYTASADTAITPARVLRWMLSLREGHPTAGVPANFEFQPIFRAKDTQRQFIAQVSYKF